MYRYGLLLILAAGCSGDFTLRLQQYVNKGNRLPSWNGQMFTCYNAQSDYHSDDCVLNFTVIATNNTGRTFLQPSALGYGDFTPQLSSKGVVNLADASRGFSFDDSNMIGRPGSIAVIVYFRGTNATVSNNQFTSHQPVSLGLMDYFEVNGDQLAKGSNQTLQMQGLLDSVSSTLVISYDLNYDDAELGPFGNMTCRVLTDNSYDHVFYECADMRHAAAAGDDFEGNYLCSTANATVQQRFFDSRSRRYFYSLATDYDSNCIFCEAGVAKDTSGGPVCAATQNKIVTNTEYEKLYKRFRTATIVLGVFFGLAILLLITACVAIIYIRGHEEDTRRSSRTYNQQPIRSWDTTKAETRPLTAAATPPRNDSPQWEQPAVRAAPPAPTTVYSNPLSAERSSASSSNGASRREAAV